MAHDPTTIRLDHGPTPGRVFRRAEFRFDGVKQTPQGGLRIDAALTRSGVFLYMDSSGKEIREYRPPSEVFSPESMATLASAPTTDLHPPVLVDTFNFRQYSTGHVAEGSVRKDGDKIAAVLVIQDASAIGAIERGDRREVSCGYTCKTDETPGTTPEGEPYDRVQRDIQYNHTAIVPDGRAGSEVALRLDSAGNQLPPGAKTKVEEISMKTIRIDGIDYPLNTDAEIHAAVAAHGRFVTKTDAAMAAFDKAASTARAEAETFKGRMDSAEAAKTKAETALAEVTAPARMDAAVAERVVLLAKAGAILGSKVKLDGKSEREIMVEAIRKTDPKVKLDDKTTMEYIRGRFEGITAKVDAADPDGLRRLHRAAVGVRDDAEDVVDDAGDVEDVEDPTDPEDVVEDPPAGRTDVADPDRGLSTSAAARSRMDKAGADAWRAPLAFSKDKPRA